MNSILTIEETIKQKLQEAIVNTNHSESKLLQVRKNAFDRFVALGLPNKQSEAYKYTPIARILSKQFEFGQKEASPTFSGEEITAHFYPIDTANHLVFVNGIYQEGHSKIESGTGELIVQTLDTETVENSQFAASFFNETKGSQVDPFVQLNAASISKGIFLTIPKESDVRPTFVYHFIDASAGEITAYPRVLVNSELGSRMSIYERTVTKGDASILNISVLEAQVAENAELRYTKVQNYATNYYGIEGIYADQKGNSRFYTNTYSFNGAVIRNNIFITVDGENSEAHMNGLYQLSGKIHVDNNTSVDHVKPNCYSNETYKGILDENSRGVFNGKIYVRPEAQKTNAFQSNNNILLSDSAVINTKPQLEIWADDVKCSHGCTTGQLDEEAIFYLRSRGISKTRAKALMLNAFANETLAEVKEELVRDEIEELITNKLG